MGNSTILSLTLYALTTQLTNIYTRCVLAFLLSPLKIIGRGGLLCFITTLLFQLRPPGGWGVTYAQTTLATTSEEGRVLFLLPKGSIGILRLGLILTQEFSKFQTLSLEVVQGRANLGALLLLLIKLILQPKAQLRRKGASRRRKTLMLLLSSLGKVMIFPFWLLLVLIWLLGAHKLLCCSQIKT